MRINHAALHLTVLGARGSMPVDGKDFSIYGGATSCYRVQAGDEEIYLDAGSGIVKARPSPHARLTLLLTHMHLDHIMGLPFFPALAQPDRTIDIYARKHSGLLPKDALDRLIAPPFWPVKLENYPSNIKIHVPSDETIKLNDVTVDMIESNHPNGSMICRLARGGRSMVYATDFEHSDPDRLNALITFADGCDLLIYDAQYTTEEYDRHRGFGHSTAEVGIEIAARAGAGRIMFVHHAPWRTDDQIADLERRLNERHGNISFAKIGDEITL